MELLAIMVIGILLVLLICAVVVTLLYVKQGFILIDNRINTSIIPKSLSLTPSTDSLAELAVEFWRLQKRIDKASEKLSIDENKAFENSVAKLQRFLEKNDIAVIDYTGQNYNEGLNLDILKIEKDSELSQSIIKKTHEPAVTHKGILIKKAKVIVHEK
jgi:hypothetical protein